MTVFGAGDARPPCGDAHPSGVGEILSAWLPGVDRSLAIARSPRIALTYFLLEAGAFIGLSILAVMPLPIVLNMLFSVGAGLATGVLFTVGHDAAHQALTDNRRLNNWIARLSFLPSAHCVSLWVLGHNRIHHRFTNLIGKDYVWQPMTVEAYRRASPARQLFYRLCRSAIGPLPYHLVEMWWKKYFLPIAPEARPNWIAHVPDSLFVVAGHLAMAIAFVAIGSSAAPDRSLWLTTWLGWLLPFLVWNWLVGLIIYPHHTHPELAWFTDEKDWNVFRAQVLGTAEARLPGILDKLNNNIMCHTAHHVYPAIPLYRLRAAQARLRAAFPAVKCFVLTGAKYLSIVRACKLYDPARPGWTDFAGRPTGPVLIQGKRDA